MPKDSHFEHLTVIGPSSNLITISVGEWPPHEVGSMTLFGKKIMQSSITDTLNRRICPDALVAVSYVIGFTATLWLLLDAEVTMVYAHYQWEIHQETALKLALVAWTPVVLVTLTTRVALRFIGRGRRQSEQTETSRGAEQSSQPYR
jgi:hypothetical protein